MKNLLSALDAQFAALHTRTLALVSVVPADKLYWQPPRTTTPTIAAVDAHPAYSCGEHLLRSAACVEQTFGGITANLWDDPFEWTLPETLSTTVLVADYLREVEATRRRGLALIETDNELLQEIILPSGEMRTLGSLLVETLMRAAHHQGRAFATFQLFSNERLPPL